MERSILLKIMVIGSILVVEVFSGVTVEVQLKKFGNSGSREYLTGTVCGRIFRTCETYFQLCIKPSNILPSDLSDCWYYKDTKAKAVRDDDVDFRRVDTGMPRTIVIHNDTWPGNFGFYLKVWNINTGTAKLIDVHKFRLPLPAEPNAGMDIRYWSSRGSRPNKPVSTFSFSLRVYCDQFYYGTDCRTYCKESDDNTNGHFICDNSGTPTCRSGWFNLPKCLTSCVPQNDSINGYYTCTNNGTKTCRQSWYGLNCLTQCIPKDDDRDGHYICSKNGIRICKQNWYGPKCLINCVPKNDSVYGYYTCSKNGTRVCKRNWYGLKCLVNCVPKNDSTNGHYTCASNGTRICRSSWYGTNCLISCVPKSNSMDGYYTCSKTGTKICQNNWYGPKCTVQCLPMNDNKNGHYTCLTNGTIVCRSNWYGPKCTVRCMPKNDIVEGHYNCAKNGSRICRRGWFGLPNCLVDCVPQDDDTNGHYSCSYNGKKICKSGWYGQRCQTYCMPKSGHTGGYICADDGTRVCLKNWTGQWCNISVSTSMIRSSIDATESRSSQGQNMRSSFTLQRSSLHKPISSTILIRISPTQSSKLVTDHKTSYSQDSAMIHSTRHHETFTIKETHVNMRASTHSPLSTALIASTTSITPSQMTSVVASTGIKSGTPIPGITVNEEGDQGIFSWLVNTSKGNMTVVGFGLAFIFFILLVAALFKICRLKRSQTQPCILVNETLPRYREEINPMHSCVDGVPSRLYDGVNDVPLRETGNNKANEADELQMCYGCFGRIPGQSQYAYQKGETGM
eukprot:Seg918.3 transcript_id=Seg918.3/GoldUCD/mRNA.D3Y31 product="Neurogenic locus protein delta" protein_id=Seg918.3/GoldUCD/D3Y31